MVAGRPSLPLATNVLELAREWMRFARRRCERGRGLRPRWAAQGFDFLLSACDPEVTHHLTDEQFRQLRVGTPTVAKPKKTEFLIGTLAFFLATAGIDRRLRQSHRRHAEDGADGAGQAAAAVAGCPAVEQGPFAVSGCAPHLQNDL